MTILPLQVARYHGRQPEIGRYCMIGGTSVINGHMEICDKVTVTGMGMVMRPITEHGVYSSGFRCNRIGVA